MDKHLLYMYYYGVAGADPAFGKGGVKGKYIARKIFGPRTHTH